MQENPLSQQKILIISSAVAPIGNGLSMGVNRGLEALVNGLEEQNYHCTVLAPQGSKFELCPLIEVQGALQTSHTRSENVTDPYPVFPNSCVANMWDFVRVHGEEYDIILNLQHDWLPFFLMDFLSRFLSAKIFHWVNLTSINHTTDLEIRKCQEKYPKQVIFKSYTQGQILTPEATERMVIYQGLRSHIYPYQDAQNNGYLAWAARISPEKGLEDSLAIARTLGEPLHIAGFIEDQGYFDQLQRDFGDYFCYRGYLSQTDLGQFLAGGRAFLQTQKWEEAFGMTTLEALACGTPVIAYRRGANQELVQDGETGFLVTPDDQGEMLQKITQVRQISPLACRRWVEEKMSLSRLGQNFHALFQSDLS